MPGISEKEQNSHLELDFSDVTVVNLIWCDLSCQRIYIPTL